MKEEYFTEIGEQVIFKKLATYFQTYGECCTIPQLMIDITDDSTLSETVFDEVCVHAEKLTDENDEHTEWLVDKTEEFCKDRALHNSIREAISIIDGDTKTVDRGAIPEILQKALAISFDDDLGHDYFEDVELRYDSYKDITKRIPCGIELLDKIMKGGVPPKTLNVIAGGTGAGKSLALCSLAANYLSSMQNVLYISMEMDEVELSKRIDSNLLHIPLSELEKTGKERYFEKFGKVKDRRKNGRLITKQYPTGSANVNHFRFLLQELKLKKGFVPDIIIIDYLNICASSRVKLGNSVNTYTLVKYIAEEIRALAIEFDVPIWSATQFNRSGQNDSDPELEKISESSGLSHTVDFFIGLVATEELQELGQVLFKQLKNRYNDTGWFRRFVVGCDRAFMRLYDIDQPDQNDMNETNGGSKPKSDFRKKMDEKKPSVLNRKKSRDFSGLFDDEG